MSTEKNVTRDTLCTANVQGLNSQGHSVT